MRKQNFKMEYTPPPLGWKAAWQLNFVYWLNCCIDESELNIRILVNHIAAIFKSLESKTKQLPLFWLDVQVLERMKNNDPAKTSTYWISYSSATSWITRVYLSVDVICIEQRITDHTSRWCYLRIDDLFVSDYEKFGKKCRHVSVII